MSAFPGELCAAAAGGGAGSRMMEYSSEFRHNGKCQSLQ